MLKKLYCYLPSLNQCWVIVFFLIAVGGLGIGTLLSVVCSAAGMDVAGINPLASYLLPLVPAFVYIYRSAPTTTQPVKIEQPYTGRINRLALYPMLAAAILALGFVTEPLSSIFPMPEYVEQIFEKILNNSFWAFATTVVAAPICEEFFLRGL